jgi:hypothetical protein
MTSSNYGPQQLDEIMTRFDISNSDIVNASTEQLTHKMVQKGRKGRRLTPHIKQKIANALNACQKEQVFTIRDLFNYG